jgi:hypothetical protein
MAQGYKGKLSSKNATDRANFYLSDTPSISVTTKANSSTIITNEKLQEIRARNPRLFKALAESDYSQ